MNQDYVGNIGRSHLTIYDPIDIGDPALWIPTPELERLLHEKLTGASLAGLANRTRSKVAKEMVCTALGYPVPSGFRRTRPRFLGQMFDTYVQKSDNLQVWNEELSPTRRYVIIILDADGLVVRVRVVTGEDLALLDTTGTLTQKYQARLSPGQPDAALFCELDTDRLAPLVSGDSTIDPRASPVDSPAAGELLAIGTLWQQLSPLIGRRFADPGLDQERNRGAALHALVCRRLGYRDYRDDGRFPDIRHQLLEVKLQTAATIDLGLVRPDSEALLDLPQLRGRQMRHCDVRYAVFYASTDTVTVTLQSLFLVTGRRFFTRFTPFGGKMLNKKLQIRLPSSFFG